MIDCCCQLNKEEDSAIHTNGPEILKLNLAVKNALAHPLTCNCILAIPSSGLDLKYVLW